MKAAGTTGLLSIRYAVPVAYKSWYQHKNRRKVSVGEATPRKLTKASAERKKKEPDGIFLSIAATAVSEEGEVEETRGLRGGELSPRSSPTPSPEVFLSGGFFSLKMQASLQRHGAGAGFLSEGQAAIDVRPSLALIRELMSKRRGQGQARRATVMPQAEASDCHAAGSAPGQGIPATRRTESGAAPGRQRGWADPRGNLPAGGTVPAGGTAIKQGLPGDNPRADGDGQCWAESSGGRRNSRPHHSRWGQRGWERNCREKIKAMTTDPRPRPKSM